MMDGMPAIMTVFQEGGQDTTLPLLFGKPRPLAEQQCAQLTSGLHYRGETFILLHAAMHSSH